METNQQPEVDALTGLHNRRFYYRVMEREVERAIRVRSPLSLACLNLDHFRLVNQRLLLPGGDKILVEIARLLRSELRTGDYVTRPYGGSDFYMILPDTDKVQALELAEHFRKAVASAVLAVPVTASIGVATMNVGASTMWDRNSMQQIAVEAIYHAKQTGNRVIHADDLYLDGAVRH